jgi:uncharacterized protein
MEVTMWLDFEKEKVGKLRNPAMVVAVSTSMPQYRALYSQARELGDYMLKNMKFEKIGTMHSSAFPPEVLVRQDGISSLPACHFHLNRGKRDLVLFTGDTSPMEEQYEFAQVLLRYAQELGASDLFSVGARWTETPLSPEANPETVGFATDKVGVARLKKHGVRILGAEPAPFFASMVVGMAKDHGIRGYKLAVDHGEASPHVKSVRRMLECLSALAEFDVPLDGLKQRADMPSAQSRAGSDSIYH